MVPGIKPRTYYISNHGRIYSNASSRVRPNGGILSHSINQKGYHQINLSLIPIDGKYRKACCKIHRLVLLAFQYIPGCQVLEVDHLDQNKDNNQLWNLQWTTPRQNTQNAIYRGYKDVSLESTGGRFLTDEEAQSLFNELISDEGRFYIYDIAEKHNVSVEYCKKLLSGAIRPYYRRAYLNSLPKREWSGN